MLSKNKNIIALVLPLAFSIYPAAVTYAQNAQILRIDSWLRMSAFQAAIGLLIFLLFSFYYKEAGYHSAISAFIFLIFYNVYGLVFIKLVELDIIQVTHYSFLPLFLLTGITLSLLIKRISTGAVKPIWQIATALVVLLLVFNVVQISSIEIRKKQESTAVTESETVSLETAAENSPDIYYLIFDEFSGFQPIREYWGYKEIDTFVDYLESKDFQVSENAHSTSIDTLHQLASRLNYRTYPLGADYVSTYYNDIANSRVFNYLKSLGYRTIVFDESKASFAYPAKPSIIADLNYENDPESVGTDTSGSLFDDYGALVADKTVLLAIADYYKIHNPELQKHKNMVYFTLNKLGELKEPDTPIFVYAHLLVPHMPFMFDRNGNNIDPVYHQNWDYYLENYIFTVALIEEMVNNILSQYEPDNQPIIILQSDHGARNKLTTNIGSKTLTNFNEEYKTSIMNAMLLPNCDDVQISDDFDPTNTFPVVFRCAFGVDIPVD